MDRHADGRSGRGDRHRRQSRSRDRCGERSDYPQSRDRGERSRSRESSFRESERHESESTRSGYRRRSSSRESRTRDERRESRSQGRRDRDSSDRAKLDCITDRNGRESRSNHRDRDRKKTMHNERHRDGRREYGRNCDSEGPRDRGDGSNRRNGTSESSAFLRHGNKQSSNSTTNTESEGYRRGRRLEGRDSAVDSELEEGELLYGASNDKDSNNNEEKEEAEEVQSLDEKELLLLMDPEAQAAEEERLIRERKRKRREIMAKYQKRGRGEDVKPKIVGDGEASFDKREVPCSPGDTSSVDTVTEDKSSASQFGQIDVESMQANIQQVLESTRAAVAAVGVGEKGQAPSAASTGLESRVSVQPNGLGTMMENSAMDRPSFDIFKMPGADQKAPAKGKDVPSNVLTTSDMFAEGDDPNLQENWDDADGYYNTRIGEMLMDRYRVLGNIGKGVFSTVLKCADVKLGGTNVAIKLIRNNTTMRKAAQKELDILKDLSTTDPENRKHVVRLLANFEHRGHIALVFEAMNMNLRDALKKFGRNVGVNLSAVRLYGRQMFIALHHLQSREVIHGDIKPDNILVNEQYNVLKICDFGSAFRLREPDNDPTPYLVSRWYRAPEIILGLQYDFAIDVWSIGCCLFEIFTGRAMFPGTTNNEMLRLMMELKGRPPHKLIRRHRAAYPHLMMEPHFDEEYRFRQQEVDKVTGKPVMKLQTFTNPTKDLGAMLMASKSTNEDRQMVVHLKDLLEKCFILDPSRRLTVKEALSHPFIKR